MKLTTFYWKAFNHEGKIISGELQANSLVLAKITLMKQNLTLIHVIPKSKLITYWQAKRIKSSQVTLFTRQLASMMKSGIPLLQSFDMLAENQNKASMRHVIHHMKHQVEMGSTLADAFRHYPHYFNDLYCELIRTGEASGTTEAMLNTLVAYREKMDRLKQAMTSAMLYPCVVLTMACLVFTLLLTEVIPQFQVLFTNMGTKLPILTLLVIQLSTFFKQHLSMMSALVTAFFIATVWLYQYSVSYRHFIARLVLHLPLIGQLVKHMILSKFARTLSLTSAAGLPLFKSLTLVEGCVGNVAYAKAIHQIQREIVNGHALKTALQKTGLFPSMLIQMISIGEATGALAHMLDQSACFYTEQLNLMVERLSTLIEPVMIVALGLLIALLVIAMYLPIFQLGTVF